MTATSQSGAGEAPMSGAYPRAPPATPERAWLVRRDLVVDLGPVIKVVVVLAGAREEELDAVRAHAVVTREQSDVTDRADLAGRVGAALHPNCDVHDVPGHAPHLRVVRVVAQVVLDAHHDQAVRLTADPEHLAEDPVDVVGAQVDVAAATLTVNTIRDKLTAHDGRCSLREAVAAAATPGRRTDCAVAGRRANVIVLAAGRYALSIAPTGLDDNAGGDLNVAGAVPLTIVGP